MRDDTLEKKANTCLKSRGLTLPDTAHLTVNYLAFNVPLEAVELRERPPAFTAGGLVRLAQNERDNEIPTDLGSPVYRRMMSEVRATLFQ